MKHPKWKQRRLKAKAELEAAERKARYDAFWAAVPKPQSKRALDYELSPPPV